jgi:Cu+-exporting ATPase
MMPASPKILTDTTTCFHCGEACKDVKLTFNQHVFCCNGCKTVFEILEGADLNCYYDIEAAPGIKPKELAGDFEFLELPEVQKQIIQFEDDEIYKLLLSIPQIHCSSCIYLLEQLHEINPSIISSRVNFQRKEIALTVQKVPNILYDTFHFLNKIGYTPQIAQPEKAIINTTSKRLIIKIGVAGFCFGNIMLLSFPDYISGNSIIEDKFEHVFNYLIVLFILPVLFYAASDYFKAAYQNLKIKNLSVDVPIVLGIFALFTRSIYEIFLLGRPGYFDSLAGFIFFLLIGKWFQSRTYENLSFNKSYSSFFPLAVLKKVKDQLIVTGIKDLKEGDIIQLRNREILPVNAQLLDSKATFDYSFVTGESKTIVKKQKDHVFAGGKLTGATAQFMVSESANPAYLQDLWNTVDAHKSDKKITNIIDAVSQRFTLIIIAFAIFGFFFWLFYADFNKALEVFTAILIVACPCALALASPFTYGNASRIFSSINVYLKDTSIVERLSKINLLVFDKTGTLTQKDSTEVQFFGEKLEENTLNAIQSIASCSIHPLSKTLVEYLDISANEVVQDYQEVDGKGMYAMVKDNEYLIGSANWLLQNGVDLKLPENRQRSSVHIAKNHQYLGYFEFGNSYRGNLLEKIKQLTSKYSISILSGDGNSEEVYLKSQLHESVQMAFHQSPEQKEAFIQQLKQKNTDAVMMLGDGINDAIALKASDIGVAVTEDTGSFTPNSDIIMHADSLLKLPQILQYGKDCMHVLYICLVISLVYNLVGLGFAFSGLLTPLVAAILMPLSSITVVFAAVGLTNYFAMKRKIKA